MLAVEAYVNSVLLDGVFEKDEAKDSIESNDSIEKKNSGTE